MRHDVKFARVARLVGLLWLLLALLTFAANCTPTVQTGTLKVYFFNVGHGDTILIQTPDGAAALIDGGSNQDTAFKYLHALGVQSLSLLIVTHPDADHIGGLAEVLENIPTERVVTNGDTAGTKVYQTFSSAVEHYSKAQTVEVASRSSQPIRLGNLDLTVLNPPAQHFGNVNDDSIVIRFTYGPTTFLLMGDAQKMAEDDLHLDEGSSSLRSTIVKVGHHGSDTSSTADFVKDVQPQVAIISDDGTHIDLSVLATLTKYAVVYETCRDGTVIVTADNTGYCVTTSHTDP